MYKKKKTTIFFLLIFCLCLITACNPVPDVNLVPSAVQEKEENTGETVVRNIMPAHSLSAELVLLIPNELRDVFVIIGDLYEADNENTKITYYFGTAAELEIMVENAVPADLLISDSVTRLNNMASNGYFSGGEAIAMGENDMILIANESTMNFSFSTFGDENITEVGIGDPQLDPFGERAQNILMSLNCEKGRNFSDPESLLAFVRATPGSMGVLAASQLRGEDGLSLLEGEGEPLYSVDIASHDWYEPIVYYAVPLLSGEQPEVAERLKGFLRDSEAVRDVLRDAGFYTETDDPVPSEDTEAGLQGPTFPES